MRNQIVVVGSSNIDLIAQLSHLPKPGETVGDAAFSQAHGGKGANQTVAAARAGAEVSFITSLGNDSFGQSMLQDFKRIGINTDYILQSKDTPTGTALIWVDTRGENSIAVAPGANHKLSPQYIDECRILLSGAELILLQLEIPFETVEYVIDLAASLGKKIMLNPAPARKLERKHLKPLFNLTVNETEAAMLSGMPVETQEQVVEAGRYLLAMGPEMVVITLGARGVFYLTKREQKMVEAYPVKPIDTTAAGDVFCGVLASQMVQNKKLADAIKYANAAAALSTTILGAQPSAPNQQQIKDFLDQYEF
ncbi:ribokinase [Catalinimonas niigatensis]|uniref:ribokinase n=1 Tax=Catalinimonas niigatensis TaxID=1397264 RepID=UPI0026665D99|nr:ribokinase [Catalinimonas niigatensis]WPP51651.1 ribokinase [Catalinimonas niigatensis]